MVIEPYRPDHRGACLTLFDSNVPRFFRAEERGEFETFLDAPPGPYLVGRIDGDVIAAGGYAEDRSQAGAWVLCWGMVAAPLHQQGFGRTLLHARLQALSELPGFREVRINPVNIPEASSNASASSSLRSSRTALARVFTATRCRVAEALGMAALGRSAPRRHRPAQGTLYLGLFGHFQSIIDFDAEVTNGTFELRVS